MKIQDTFGDISKTFGKKWRKIFNKEENAIEPVADGEKREVKAGEAEGSFSMTQGDHGTIFGLSRPVVTGIGVFFFVVFAAAFFYASSNDSAKQQQAQQQAKESDIANPNRAAGGKNENATDDYGELARINAAKNRKSGQNPNNPNGQNPNNPNVQGANGQNPNMQPAQAVRAQAMPSSPVPVVPRPSVVVPAAGAYPQVGQAGQNADDATAREREEEHSVAQRLKEKLNSSIAFAFDGGGKGAAETAVSNNAAANESSSMPASAGASAGRGAVGLMQTSANSAPVYSEPTERTVMAGTIIPAMLITGINTDAPGPVIAQVMADVYDMHGRTLIIPAGSRVLGTMTGNSGGGSGTTGRIGVTFDTIALPNGGAWNIGQSIMAVDGAGYAGIGGRLHRHTGSNLMKGLFNSALTALSTASVDRVTFDASALKSLTEQQAPTATVAPGYSFNLYVTANIAF